MLGLYDLLDQTDTLSAKSKNKVQSSVKKVPVFGLFQPSLNTEFSSGRIAVFGDSNCLDGVHNTNQFCFDFVERILEYTSKANLGFSIGTKAKSLRKLGHDFSDDSQFLPARMVGSDLMKYSRIVFENEKDNPYSSEWQQQRQKQSLEQNVEPIESIIERKQETEGNIPSGQSSRKPVGFMIPVLASVIFFLIIAIMLLNRKKSSGIRTQQV